MNDDIRKELEDKNYPDLAELRRIEMEKLEALSEALDIIYDEQPEEE